jgi:hypothetical protein
MFVQLFDGWRYRPGVRSRLAELGLGAAPAPAPRPDVPGLIARLLATEVDDPDTGIGLWIWQDEAACRAYEAGRTPEATARLEQELDHSDLTERTFDALLFGARIPDLPELDSR